MNAQSYKQNLHIISSNYLTPGALYNKVVLLDMIFFVQLHLRKLRWHLSTGKCVCVCVCVCVWNNNSLANYWWHSLQELTHGMESYTPRRKCSDYQLVISILRGQPDSPIS